MARGIGLRIGEGTGCPDRPSRPAHEGRSRGAAGAVVAAVVGAVAVTPVPGTAKARAVLTAHDFNPDDDSIVLQVAIEACGWRVSVEQAASRGSGGRPARWRALATRPPELQEHRTGVRPHLMVSGPSARHVLVAVLAQSLEREA